jgi:hypothetical protein
MSDQAQPREYEVGRICGTAMERLEKANAAFGQVYDALLAGGHLDAAEIVNKQRMHIVLAKQDLHALIQAGGDIALLGWGERTR